MKKKSGVVAIIGRANVGKSTLLNRLVGEKVAIVSSIPQTTRNQIRAIFNNDQGQIVFIDTPGLHASRHALDRAMASAITDSLMGADIIIHLVDATEQIGEEEALVMERLGGLTIPIVLALNKIDRNAKHLEDYLHMWEKRLKKPLSEMIHRVVPIPMSALTGTNVDALLEELFKRLPEGEPLYPENVLTDFPRQLTIQDIIREKLLLYIKEELPFSVAVFAEEVVERSKKLTYVKASILVERQSQKAIVIGHKGELLKKVGEAARKELEKIYEKKFYLDLWVDVDKGWKQNNGLLRQMGYIG